MDDVGPGAQGTGGPDEPSGFLHRKCPDFPIGSQLEVGGKMDCVREPVTAGDLPQFGDGFCVGQIAGVGGLKEHQFHVLHQRSQPLNVQQKARRIDVGSGAHPKVHQQKTYPRGGVQNRIGDNLPASARVSRTTTSAVSQRAP